MTKETTEHDVQLEKEAKERAKWILEADVRKKELENEDKLDKRKHGLVGLLIGSGEKSKINAAYTLIIISVLFLLSSYLVSENELSNNTVSIINRIWDIFPAMITLSLGYIFGKGITGKSD